MLQGITFLWYWEHCHCTPSLLLLWKIIRLAQDITHRPLHQSASVGFLHTDTSARRAIQCVWPCRGFRGTDGNNQRQKALNEALTSELTAVAQTDNPTWQTARQHYLFWIYDGRRCNSLCRPRGRPSGKGQILNLLVSADDCAWVVIFRCWK